MAGPTVTVACKLPAGLILRVYDFVEASEPVMGGGTRTVRKANPRPQEVHIAGWSHPQNRDSKAPIVEGFALTPGVDKEFWDLWKSQNATAPYIKNGLIFAHEKPSNIEAEAREKKTVVSGLERLDPAKKPRGIEKSDLVAA